MNKCTWCGKHYSGTSVYRRNGNYCGNKCAVEFDNHEEAQRRQRAEARRKWEEERPQREAEARRRQEEHEKVQEIELYKRFLELIIKSKQLGMTIPEYRDHLVNKKYKTVYKSSGASSVFIALPLSFAFFYWQCPQRLLLQPSYSRPMHGLTCSLLLTFVIFCAGCGILASAIDKDVKVLDHFIDQLGRDHFTR